jgi:hypothetical protein
VLSFFSWHGKQQYSSSQTVFVFTTIGPVTGPSSSFVDVGSGEATADASSCLRLNRSSTSHLEVYVSVEVPTKVGPLHLGHFPPSSDHKDQARVT